MTDQETIPHRLLSWLGPLAFCMGMPWLVMLERDPNFHQAAKLVGMTSASVFLIVLAFGLIAEHGGKRVGVGALVVLFASLAYMVMPLLLTVPSASWSDQDMRLAIATLACSFVPILFLAQVWSGIEVCGVPGKLVLPVSTANTALFIWSGLSSHPFLRIFCYGSLLLLTAVAYAYRTWRRLCTPS